MGKEVKRMVRIEFFFKISTPQVKRRMKCTSQRVSLAAWENNRRVISANVACHTTVQHDTSNTTEAKLVQEFKALSSGICMCIEALTIRHHYFLRDSLSSFALHQKYGHFSV